MQTIIIHHHDLDGFVAGDIACLHHPNAQTLKLNYDDPAAIPGPEQLKDFQTLIKAIDSKAEMVGVAPLALFDDFSKAMVQFGKTQNIKSIGATIQFLTELALKEVEAWQDRQNTTQSTTTRG